MNKQPIHDRIMSRENNAIHEGGDVAKPKRAWLRKTLLSLLGIAVVGSASYVAMRYDVIANLISQPAIAETNDKAGPARDDTPFLQHARQAGLKSCLRVFPGLGALLTNGSQYSVESIWNADTPDKHAVQALVGMNYATKGYSGPAAGVVVAAPTGTLCEGSMVRVAPFSASCADIPAMLPNGSRLANTLAQISVYELPNNGGHAMLLPTGNSCVVISVASATAAKGDGN